jgi:Peptidase family C25
MFLIVAPEQFHPSLADFVAHKQKQFPTRLVSLEQILKTSEGVDDPEKLKRYLFDTWKHEKLGYVLLVGDADVLPVRYMTLDRNTEAAFNYAFYPSDLYYSDLADENGGFEDWNARREDFHEGYFGEVCGEHNKDDPINYDETDYLPDVAVGRWPVSIPDEVKLVAGKSIGYELHLANRPRDAALISVGGWVDSRPVLDTVSKNLQKNWVVTKRYYADPRRNDETPPPTEAELVGLLNRGTTLVFHAGHGTDNSWHQCFSVKSIEGLTNKDHLPVMISAGCSTARLCSLPPYEAYLDVNGKSHLGTDRGEVFTAPPPPPAPYQTGKFNTTGLGEKLLRGGPDGAAAYIGCNTGSQPCGLTLLDGFSQSISTRTDPRLGDCWADAIRYYHTKEHLADLKPTNDWYPPSIFFQGMKFMLFGDPTLPLAAGN